MGTCCCRPFLAPFAWLGSGNWAACAEPPKAALDLFGRDAEVRVRRTRSDVLPLTWEVPAAVAGVWVMLMVLALPAGQGLACAVTGHGFIWPQGGLAGSVRGLFAGTPGRGLTPREASQIPASSLVYAAVVILEVMLTAVAVWGLTWWWGSIGPGAQTGIAGKHEVQRVLGAGSLSGRRAVIRPDLFHASRHLLRQGRGR